MKVVETYIVLHDDMYHILHKCEYGNWIMFYRSSFNELKTMKIGEDVALNLIEDTLKQTE